MIYEKELNENLINQLDELVDNLDLNDYCKMIFQL